MKKIKILTKSNTGYTKTHHRQEKNFQEQAKFNNVKVKLESSELKGLLMLALSQKKIIANVFVPYCRIPEEYYDEKIKELKESIKILFNALLEMQQWTWRIEPSQIGYLAKKTGLARETINRGLRYLHSIGFIHLENNGFKTRCTYFINAYFLNRDIRDKYAWIFPALFTFGKANSELQVTLSLSSEEEIQILTIRHRTKILNLHEECFDDDAVASGNSLRDYIPQNEMFAQGEAAEGECEAEASLIVGGSPHTLNKIARFNEYQMQEQFEFAVLLDKLGLLKNKPNVKQEPAVNRYLKVEKFKKVPWYSPEAEQRYKLLAQRS